MIVGVGIDIAEVSRVRAAIERRGERLLKRLFTPDEIAYCQGHKNCYERFAARFAAKEAAMKALGTGWRKGITWRDLEVSNSTAGKPSLKLSGRASEIYRHLGGLNIVLSITHTPVYALAEVIVESEAPATT